MTRPPPPRDPDPRRGRGARGERLAAEHLATDGFRVVDRNVRTTHGEIDLLVRRGRLWVAVEVKTRVDHPAPERTVDPAQLARVHAALVALAPALRPLPRALRVDVVAVRTPRSGDTEVRHFPGKPARWRPG